MTGERRELVQPFGEVNVRFVGRDLIRGVREMLELLAQRSEDARVPVARIEHGNAAREVDVASSLRVPELGIFGAPTYVLGTERFWGQDRLDFVDRALAVRT